VGVLLKKKMMELANNNNNNNNNNNWIQFFIISVLHQQPEGQLQMQHKGIQDTKYNKITI
jgi:hypothetical protein